METRWIATTVVLVVSASIIQSPTTAGFLVTQSIDSEDACERQKMNLRCNPGEKIVVQEGGVHYGLLSDSYCYTPSFPLPSACVVDPKVASDVLSAMCNNKDWCRFTPDDSMFGANVTACPLFASTNSILRATYNCCTEVDSVTNISHSSIPTVVNVTTDIVTNVIEIENVTVALVQDSKRDSPLTATYTLPTAPPKPCALSATKVVNCYLWECRGQWMRVSVDRSDPSCCALWDGCETSTITFNTATSTLTISAASCPAVTTVHRNYNITWRRASANMTRISPCPGDTRAPPSVARRLCKDGGVWDEYINMSLCISPEILNVTSKSVGSGEELEDFSSQLARATDSRQLSTNEIEHVIDELDNIGKGIEKFKPAAIENITQNALHVGENLLGTINEVKASETDIVSSSEEGMKVVDAIKKMASEVARQATTNITVQSRSTELYVKVVERSNHHKNQDISVKSEKGNSIAFPSRNLIPEHQDSEFGRLVAVFYTNYTRIWSSQDNQTVSSSVFSVAIVDEMAEREGERRSLDAPFQYLLQHQRLPNTGSSSCVFWDNNNTSRWSGDGCRQVKTSNTTTTCECNHLTNFAVLLDVTGEISEGHVALTAITYIGCIISIVCLLLAWITFQCLKNLSSDRNTIHKHLVFNLMLAEVLFLFAISPLFVQFTVFCQVLAGLLHFLFLCVFAWTCLEGVQLYIMLIEVFEAERSRTMYYYLAGYGIPAIVVGVSAAVDHNGYGRPEVCWLKTNTGFIWSFAGPVAGVMLINTIMLGVAVYMMYKHAKMVANMKHKESSKIDSIRAWLKGAAVLIILLGLTWIFGFGSLDGNKDIQLTMAYIFTVLNSLQGLFIFIFHCVKNEKVQKEYKRYVRRAQWLPTCLRIRYGEHKGLSSVPSHSSNSSGYLSKYFARRRKSSSDLTNSSLRAKKQISGLTSLNTEDSQAEKKELLTIHHQRSLSNGNNEQQAPLMAAHQGKPSPV